MAKPASLDKRRKSIRNIRKITRTMELIATARFKKAMDRAVGRHGLHQADHRAGRPTCARAACEVSHPLLGSRENRQERRRCWCSPPTAACAAATTRTSCARRRQHRCENCKPTVPNCRLEVVRQARHRRLQVPRHRCPDVAYTHFEDKPSFDEVDVARQPLPRRLHHRQARSARRRLHEVRQRRPAAAPSSRRCCRSARSAATAPAKASQSRRQVRLRVPARRREHSGRGRAGQLQDASCSSAFSTRPSASRSPAWSP